MIVDGIDDTNAAFEWPFFSLRPLLRVPLEVYLPVVLSRWMVLQVWLDGPGSS